MTIRSKDIWIMRCGLSNRRINVGFVIGCLLTTAVFVLLNARSYVLESTAFDSRTIHFSHEGFFWGFPLRWIYVGTCYPCDVLGWQSLIGLYLNILTGILAAIGVGFLLNKLIQKRTSLV